MFFQTLNSAEQVIEKNRYFPEFLKNYKFVWVEDGEIENEVWLDTAQHAGGGSNSMQYMAGVLSS